MQLRPETVGNPPISQFHPFALAPSKDYMDVQVTMHMQGCMQAGTGATFGSIPVAYRVLGVPHHTVVYLRSSITVVGGRRSVCQH